MVRKFLATAGAAAALACAGHAHAVTTITFNDVNPNPCCDFMQSYVSDGMGFHDAYGDGGGLLFFPPDTNPNGYENIDPGGASILAMELEMRVNGGGTFDFDGFTFATSIHDNRPFISGYQDVRFTFADYSTETDRFFTDTFGPVTVAFGRSNVRIVDFLPSQIVFRDPCCTGPVTFTNNPFVLDNIVVDNLVQAPDPPPPRVPVVPEPEEWILMLMGLGGVGAALRR